MEKRTLVVVRHAKAEQFAATDFERPLSDRGRRDAAAAGAWLASASIEPDRALVSAAKRTHQTWEEIAEAAAWDVLPDLDEALYGADDLTVCELLNLLDENVECAIVVGHNPTMEMLAQSLDDGEGDENAVNGLLMGFPTSAMAVFDVEVPWSRVGRGTATLRAFHVARA